MAQRRDKLLWLQDINRAAERGDKRIEFQGKDTNEISGSTSAKLETSTKTDSKALVDKKAIQLEFTSLFVIVKYVWPWDMVLLHLPSQFCVLFMYLCHILHHLTAGVR